MRIAPRSAPGVAPIVALSSAPRSAPKGPALPFFFFLTLAIAAAAPAAMAAGKPTRGSGIKPDVLYHNYCSVCHGDRGDGNSRAVGSLNPPPRNFLLSNVLGRAQMIEVIRDGKPPTAMVGWGTQLSRQEIEQVADYIRETFMKPALDPKVQRGKQIYARACINCHGERGEGIPVPGWNVQPRDFAAPQARTELSRERMLDAVTHGRSGTMMVSFKGQLAKKEIEAVVAYIEAILMVPATQISGISAHGGRQQDAERTLLSGAGGRIDDEMAMPGGLKGDPVAGRKFFLANCAECHGVKGDGQGKRAYFINPRPRNFTSESSRATLNRPALFGFISQGKPGTDMPAWNKVLSDQEIANVAEYVFRTHIRPGSRKNASGTEK